MAKFILVGPNEGKTIKLDRFDFVDGVFAYETNSATDLQAVAFHLGTYYSAFHEDVVEIARRKYAETQALAVEQPKSLLEAAKPHNIEQQKAPELPADLAPPKVTAVDPLDAPLVDDPLGEAGSGQKSAKPETVADALQGLDPDKDTDWTGQGLPSVDAVTAAMGRTVTRKEIEEAGEGFTRAAAKAARA